MQLQLSEPQRKADPEKFLPYLECKLEISLEYIQDIASLPESTQWTILGQALKTQLKGLREQVLDNLGST